MKKILFTGMLPVMLLTAASCGNQKYPGFEKIDDVNVKYHIKSESTMQPTLNDWVTLDMIYTVGDSVLFNSNEMGEPMSFPMILPTFKGDLYAGLSLLNIGDSVTFVFPADSFYMKTAGYPEMPDFVKPNSNMYFHVKLLKIQTEKELEEERLAEMKIIREQEQEILDSYVAANHSGAVPKPSGLYVIEQRPGSGRLPGAGDMLRLHFSIENLNGDLLFSTEGMDPVDVEFGSEFDTKAFDEGVGYVRKGGKAKLIAPSFLAYDSVGVPQVLPPFTSLVYNIELLDILSVEQVERERMQKAQAEESKRDQARLNESGLIQQYLRENQYEVQPMPSGLYYIEVEKGTGPRAEQGNTVEVHYTLYNIQGRQLQSSREFGETFKLTVGVGQVIKGWDEGLLLMHQGGKARFIIPSELAYGATQRGEDIPPYSPLVFDVEMIAVTP